MLYFYMFMYNNIELNFNLKNEKITSNFNEKKFFTKSRD
jgi:hypothetical protein